MEVQSIGTSPGHKSSNDSNLAVYLEYVFDDWVTGKGDPFKI